MGYPNGRETYENVLYFIREMLIKSSFKPQWDATGTEWLSEILKIPSVSEDMEEAELTDAGGRVIWYSYIGKLAESTTAAHMHIL